MNITAHRRSILSLFCAAAFLFSGFTQPPVQTPPPPEEISRPVPGESADEFGSAEPISMIANGSSDQFGYTVSLTEPIAWTALPAGVQQVAFTGSGGSVFTGDDIVSGPIDIVGFEFPYYENTYSQLYITDNGIVSFASQSGLTSGRNEPLPSVSPLSNLIAVYWDDLEIVAPPEVNPEGDYGVFTWTGTDAGKKYIAVRWSQVRLHVGITTPLSFQVLLYETGDIVMHYLQISDAFESGTIGIEDASSTDGITVVHNERSMAAETAFRFIRPQNYAGVKFDHSYQSSFLLNGSATFDFQVSNVGDLGADSFTISSDAANGWQVAFFSEAGTSIINTGTLQINESKPIHAVVTAPAGTVAGDSVTINVSAKSGRDASVIRNLVLQVTEPIPFTQAYTFQSMNQNFIWGRQNRTVKITSDWTGSNFSMLQLPNGGYAYVWERNTNGGTNLEYLLLNRYGMPISTAADVRPPLPEGETVRFDKDPVLAVNNDGKIGLAWQSYTRATPPLYHYVYNIWFATLESNGQWQVKNLTNNSLEYIQAASDQNVGKPRFFSPSITSTPNGQFAVSWLEENADITGQTTSIGLAVLSSSGTVQNPGSLYLDPLKSDPGSPAYFNPTITGLSDNRFLLNYSVNTAGLPLHAAIFNSGGSLLTVPAALAGLSADMLDTAQFANGSVALTWVNPTTRQVQFALMNVAGASPTLGSVQTLETAYDLQATSPSISIDALGNGIITWGENWNRSLNYALINAAGDIVTSPLIFLQTESDNEAIFTSSTGQGNAPYDGYLFTFIPSVMKFSSK